MTDDIVTRLRTWGADESTWDLLTGAADEIERLRDALLTIIGALDDPTGGQHVADMRMAASIATTALAGEKADDAAT